MNPRGFTLVEVMMTIGILAALFFGSVYGFSALQRSFASQTVDREITNMLTVAARNARMGFKGGTWGVYIPYDNGTRHATSITVFHGATYATRTVADDITFPVNSDVAFTSVDFSGAASNTGNDHELIFAALSGSTTQYGSIAVSWYGQTRTITIDADGFITREAL